MHKFPDYIGKSEHYDKAVLSHNENTSALSNNTRQTH